MTFLVRSLFAFTIDGFPQAPTGILKSKRRNRKRKAPVLESSAPRVPTDLVYLRRRRNGTPMRPRPSKVRLAGSGVVVTAPSEANPVTSAPLLASAGELVTKMCAAARFPSELAMSTLSELAQVPLVFVRRKLIVSDE
jgi:hypothetical protein